MDHASGPSPVGRELSIKHLSLGKQEPVCFGDPAEVPGSSKASRGTRHPIVA